MMNTRILDLIQSPELLTETDIKLLSEEIKTKPYMQSLRSLHLMAISRFNPENYQSELSRTAAYTTDKKILYHFINGKLPVSSTPQGIKSDAAGESAASVITDSEKIHPAVLTEKEEDASSSSSINMQKDVPDNRKVEEQPLSNDVGNGTNQEKLNFDLKQTDSASAQKLTGQEILQTQNATDRSASAVEEQIIETEKELDSTNAQDNATKKAVEDLAEKDPKVSAQDIVSTAAAVDEPASDIEEKLVENQKDIAAASETETNVEAEQKTVEELKTAVSQNIKTASAIPDATENTKLESSETKFLVLGQIGREEVQPTAIMVEGKPNRILFKGEENFMHESAPAKIDLEMTKEAGKLVTEKPVQSAEQPTADDIEVLENVEKKEEVIQEAVKTISENPGNISAEKFEQLKKANEKSPEERAEEQQLIRNDSVPSNNEGGESKNHTVTPNKEGDITIKSENIGISSSDEVEADTDQVSYGDVGSFMPEVHVKPGQKSEEQSFADKENDKKELSRHELEMRQLIEEVERKIQRNKAKKEAVVREPEIEPENHEVNFQENHDQPEVKEEKISKDFDEKASVRKQDFADVQPENAEEVVKPSPDTGSKSEKNEWKPMNFMPHQPDALPTPKISETETGQFVKPAKSEEAENAEAIKSDVKKSENQELPEPSNETVENATPIDLEESAQEIASSSAVTQSQELSAEVNESQSQSAASNIPKFINTWQSWLKIDRNAVQFTETSTDPEIISDQQILETAAESDPQNSPKEQAIEKFIENEPKISQLKDEGNFVVREKKGDISHLMTETLAGIYAEQRLYAKAINGYKILIEKYPEKQHYFEQKIEEVKEMRSANQFGGNS